MCVGTLCFPAGGRPSHLANWLSHPKVVANPNHLARRTVVVVADAVVPPTHLPLQRPPRLQLPTLLMRCWPPLLLKAKVKVDTRLDMRAVALQPATHPVSRVGALLDVNLDTHLAMPGVDLPLVVADTIELFALVVVIDTSNGANGVHHNGGHHSTCNRVARRAAVATTTTTLHRVKKSRAVARSRATIKVKVATNVVAPPNAMTKAKVAINAGAPPSEVAINAVAPPSVTIKP